MSFKPIVIVPGEKKSIFFEIFFKSLKSKFFLSPLILICDKKNLDQEIKRYKGYSPEIRFQFRKEILQSIKHVSKVIPCNFFISDAFLKKHKIDYLIHGNDNLNSLPKKKIKLFNRTKNISSTIIRKRACINLKKK